MILHTKYWISSGQGDFPPEISTAGSVLGKKRAQEHGKTGQTGKDGVEKDKVTR